MRLVTIYNFHTRERLSLLLTGKHHNSYSSFIGICEIHLGWFCSYNIVQTENVPSEEHLEPMTCHHEVTLTSSPNSKSSKKSDTYYYTWWGSFYHSRFRYLSSSVNIYFKLRLALLILLWSKYYLYGLSHDFISYT